MFLLYRYMSTEHNKTKNPCFPTRCNVESIYSPFCKSTWRKNKRQKLLDDCHNVQLYYTRSSLHKLCNCILNKVFAQITANWMNDITRDVLLCISE